MVKEILYYTDCKLKHKELFKWSKKTIEESGLPILTISLKDRVRDERNIILNAGRAHSTLYLQILLGLMVSEADYVFFCEHDVLYHPSHFDFTPPTREKYYYNNNVYKYRLSDRKVVGYDCNWLSQLCASRELLIKHYTKRFKMIAHGQKAYGWEPGSGQSRAIDKVPLEHWESDFPNLDVRHGQNWTGVKRMDPSEFRNKKTCQNFDVLSVPDIKGWDHEKLLSL